MLLKMSQMIIMGFRLQIIFFLMTYTYLKAKKKAKKRGERKCSTNGLKSWRTFPK